MSKENIIRELIFIDNEDERTNADELDSVKDALEYFGKLPSSYVNTIKSISNFGRMDKDKAYKILYEGHNCICSWSMYTANHYGSLYQLRHFLRTAAVSEIKDRIYINCADTLERALQELLKDDKGIREIIESIEANYILTVKETSIVRLRVEFKGLYTTPFRHEKINLKNLLGIKNEKHKP